MYDVIYQLALLTSGRCHSQLELGTMILRHPGPVGAMPSPSAKLYEDTRLVHVSLVPLASMRLSGYARKLERRRKPSRPTRVDHANAKTTYLVGKLLDLLSGGGEFEANQASGETGSTTLKQTLSSSLISLTMRRRRSTDAHIRHNSRVVTRARLLPTPRRRQRGRAASTIL